MRNRLLAFIFVYLLTNLPLPSQAQSVPTELPPILGIALDSRNSNNQAPVRTNTVYGETGDTVRLTLTISSGRNGYMIIRDSAGGEVKRLSLRDVGSTEDTLVLPATDLYEVTAGVDLSIIDGGSYLDNTCYGYCLQSGNSVECAEQCTTATAFAGSAYMLARIDIEETSPIATPALDPFPSSASISQQLEFAIRAYWTNHYPVETVQGYFDDIIAQDPDNLLARAYRANNFRRLNDLEAAQAELDAIFAIDPRFSTALAVQGRVVWAVEDDVNAARALFDQAIASNRNDPLGSYYKGLVLVEQDDDRGAMIAFNNAIAAGAQGSMYLSRAPLQSETIDRIKDYMQALALDPTNPTVLGNLAANLTRLTGAVNYGYAVVLARRAQFFAPDWSYPYYVEGRTWNTFREFSTQAIAALDTAIELNPTYMVAYRERGTAFGYLENYPEAIADLTKALELDPDNMTTLAYRSNAYSDAGQYSLALADAEAMIALEPNEYDGYFHKMYVLRDMGDSAGARAACLVVKRMNGPYDSSIC